MERERRLYSVSKRDVEVDQGFIYGGLVKVGQAEPPTSLLGADDGVSGLFVA